MEASPRAPLPHGQGNGLRQSQAKRLEIHSCGHTHVRTHTRARSSAHIHTHARARNHLEDKRLRHPRRSVSTPLADTDTRDGALAHRWLTRVSSGFHTRPAGYPQRRLRGAEDEGALACWFGWGGARGGGCELLAGRHCPELGALPGGSGSVHPTLHVLLTPGGGLAEHELPRRRAPSQRQKASRAHLLLTELFRVNLSALGETGV